MKENKTLYTKVDGIQRNTKSNITIKKVKRETICLIKVQIGIVMGLTTKTETQRKQSSVLQWIGISKILLVWNDIQYYRLCFLLP